MAVRKSSPVTRAVGNFTKNRGTALGQAFSRGRPIGAGPTPTHGPGNPQWEAEHAAELQARATDGNPTGGVAPPAYTPTHGPGNPQWEAKHAEELAQRATDGNPTGGVAPPAYTPGIMATNPDPGFQPAFPPATPQPIIPGNPDVGSGLPLQGTPVRMPAPLPAAVPPPQGIDNLMLKKVPVYGSQPMQPANQGFSGSQPMQPAPQLAMPQGPQSPAMTYARWNQLHPGENQQENRASFGRLGQRRPPIPGGAAANAMTQAGTVGKEPAPGQVAGIKNAIMPNMQTGR